MAVGAKVALEVIERAKYVFVHRAYIKQPTDGARNTRPRARENRAPSNFPPRIRLTRRRSNRRSMCGTYVVTLCGSSMSMSISSLVASVTELVCEVKRLPLPIGNTLFTLAVSRFCSRGIAPIAPEKVPLGRPLPTVSVVTSLADRAIFATPTWNYSRDDVSRIFHESRISSELLIDVGAPANVILRATFRIYIEQDKRVTG